MRSLLATMYHDGLLCQAATGGLGGEDRPTRQRPRRSDRLFRKERRVSKSNKEKEIVLEVLKGAFIESRSDNRRSVF
jgi:hypothetical protein